jgi:antitoxin HicB
MVKLNNKHIGSDFDDFLAEEEVLAEVEASALKRVFAWQIAEEMKKQKLTKAELARRMRTSRMAVDRLLNPSNDGLTLKNLEKAAFALNKSVKIELTDRINKAS